MAVRYWYDHRISEDALWPRCERCGKLLKQFPERRVAAQDTEWPDAKQVLAVRTCRYCRRLDRRVELVIDFSQWIGPVPLTEGGANSIDKRDCEKAKGQGDAKGIQSQA